MPNSDSNFPGKKHENASTATDKLLGHASKIIKKIENQIVRFHRMAPPEKIKYFQSHRMASFCTLKMPFGRELLYGPEGEDRFGELCNIIVSFSPEIDGKVSYAITSECIKSAFCEQFVLKGDEVNKHSAKAMLESAVTRIKSKFQSFEHHIPCVFFIEDSPDFFNIGPVRFTKVDVFLNESRERLRKYDTEGKDFVDRAESHFKQSVSYYKEFPWVASVIVEQCDFAISLENAIFNCDTALNIVRVFFGRSQTKWIRLGTSQGEALRTARMWSVDQQGIQCALSFRVTSPPGPSNWFEYLNHGEGHDIKMFLGHVLEYSRVFMPHSELSSRLLDAVNWFGDACLEKSPAAAIVKYVTSIERLYFGSQYQGMKSRFSARVSKILKDFECGGANNALESANRVYDVRSTLVHGAVSQRLGDEQWPINEAEELAKNCIFCAQQMYVIIMNAFNPLSADDFESALVKYEENGVEWCVSEARKNEI